MLNIFVTYRCNLACAYCFARELAADFPEDLAPENFERLLAWMVEAKLPAAAFIGGEPTLHPRLAEMIARTVDAGVSAVLFTNGLFPAGLADRLAPLVANFVVNYNDPAVYTTGPGRDPGMPTCRGLASLGARLTFSKNFSSRYSDYGYLIEGLARYGVKNVRYDISRPSASGANEHIAFGWRAAWPWPTSVGFVQACEERGVRTGLDCSARLCDLAEADRRYLEQVSMKFSGVCHPSLDVHPDLSASYCLPLRDVRVADVTEFPGPEALTWHFARAARALREADPSGSCFGCKDFPRRCQGGCLALKRAAISKT